MQRRAPTRAIPPLIWGRAATSASRRTVSEGWRRDERPADAFQVPRAAIKRNWWGQCQLAKASRVVT